MRIWVLMSPGEIDPKARVRTFADSQLAVETFQTASPGATLVASEIEGLPPGVTIQANNGQVHIGTQVVRGGVGINLG